MQGQTGQPEFLKRGRELRLSGLGIECELPNLKQTKTNTCGTKTECSSSVFTDNIEVFFL